jgi:hypothetical protein
MTPRTEITRLSDDLLAPKVYVAEIRGYRVAQAMTAEGLQAIVNNLLQAGFEPVGGVSVTLIGTMHEEPIVLHTQALFCTSNVRTARKAIKAAVRARKQKGGGNG